MKDMCDLKYALPVALTLQDYGNLTYTFRGTSRNEPRAVVRLGGLPPAEASDCPSLAFVYNVWACMYVYLCLLKLCRTHYKNAGLLGTRMFLRVCHSVYMHAYIVSMLNMKMLFMHTSHICTCVCPHHTVCILHVCISQHTLHISS